MILQNLKLQRKNNLLS